MPPIPPYEYPPVARSSPGDSPEEPEESHDGQQITPAQPPTRPVVRLRPVVPEKPIEHVVMSHPETVTLPTVQEVVRQPESLTPVKEKPLTKVQKSKPGEINEKLTSGQKPVEKATKPVEKATGKGKIKKLDVYDGEMGRKHTESQIEEILDVYLQTGLLPTYVTQKMRWNYKHHRRLPERRELLEQAGKRIVVPEIGRDAHNVIPMDRTNVHNQKRTS